MIPKIIHYVWLGGNPLPEYAKKNIESWKKYNPDYQIKEWNESNFDFNLSDYAKEAYSAKKWGFVPDFMRLWILYNFGGIYLDVDVECVKSFDGILDNKAVLSFEGDYYFSSAIMLSEAGNSNLKIMLEAYNDRHFIVGKDCNGEDILDLFSMPAIITSAFMKYHKKHFIKNGLYQLDDVTILPKDYLSPNIWIDLKDHSKCITENTISIHHFEGSWKEKDPIMLTFCQKLYIKIRFIIAFQFTAILGNVNFLKLEQSTYKLVYKYNKNNKIKKRKHLSEW